jgi:hypothetical protein
MPRTACRARLGNCSDDFSIISESLIDRCVSWRGLLRVGTRRTRTVGAWRGFLASGQ